MLLVLRKMVRVRFFLSKTLRIQQCFCQDLFSSGFAIVDVAVDILSQYSVFAAAYAAYSRGEKQLKLLFRFKTSSAAYAVINSPI